MPTGDIGGVTVARDRSQLILSQMGVYYEGTRERDQFICHRIMICLAGEAAQNAFCPESVHPDHASDDRRKVNSLIKEWDKNAYPHEREVKINELYAYTQELLTTPIRAAGVHALARALLEHKQISGEQARTVILAGMNEAAQAAQASGQPPLDLKCPHCAEYAKYS